MAVTRTIRIRRRSQGPSRAPAEREARRSRRRSRRTSRSSPRAAENATITDVDGNVFVDFAGGVGVVNAGHAHPRVVDAVVDQADRFLHTDYTVVPYETYVALAERLCALVPIAGETRAAFFNAGTEAVENAVKLARLHTGRPGVIAFEGGFHGRTLLSLTMTSKSHPYKAGMGPFAPEVYRAPYPNAYRGPEPSRRSHAPARARDARRAGARRGDRLRAPARRGRLHPGAARVRRGASRALRPPRDRPRRRRGADGLRAHRPDVRDGALRGRARPRHGREVDRRGASALGGDRARGDHGRRACGRYRRHVHREPGRAGRGARGARRLRGRGPRCARDRRRRPDPRADARLAGALAGDRRRARPRRDARARARPRPRDEGARAGAREA